MTSLLAHEPALRLGAFLAVFGGMALWEALAPRRAHRLGRRPRWTANLGLSLVDTVAVRLVFPAAAVGAAALAADRGWGLFPLLGLPGWVAVPAAVLLLDLVVYVQHVVFHAIPALWRIHRVHHADLDFDLTTGLRFHPVEILVSMLFKMGVVVALGAPVVAVLLFEVLLNATSVFNHGNVRMPARLDRWLRAVLVTPDMHRVHHSVLRTEANSNFGFCLSWWDRLLGTYRARPRAGHEAMTIGIEEFQDAAGKQGLGWLLRLPFVGPAGRYPIGGREA